MDVLEILIDTREIGGGEVSFEPLHLVFGIWCKTIAFGNASVKKHCPCKIVMANMWTSEANQGWITIEFNAFLTSVM